MKRFPSAAARRGRSTINWTNRGRKQVILAGIKTHARILQTADDLIQKGYAVHAVADAVSSRRKLDWEIGLRCTEKKGGDDLDHRDHRLSTVEGGWDGGVQEFIKTIKMTNLSTVEPPILDQSKQFGEEIGDEECVRKDQCPAGDSL